MIKPNIYDLVIVFETDDVDSCLTKAKRCKTEFKAGDSIENRGTLFMQKVAQTMKQQNFLKCPVIYINITNKSLEDVHHEVFAHVLPVIERSLMIET